MKGRYKSIAPLEIAPWYFRGIPYCARGTITPNAILSKSSPMPCPCPHPCPCLCLCIVSFGFSFHVHLHFHFRFCFHVHFMLFHFKYGAMNICGRHGNYIVKFQGSEEVGLNLKGLSYERGWLKSAYNLGASPFKRDLSNDTTFSQTDIAGQSL